MSISTTIVSRDYSSPTEYATGNFSGPSNSCFNTYKGVHPVVWSKSTSGYYTGIRTENYFKRLHNGDLLPFQPYTRWDTTGSLSGSETITHTLCGGYTSVLDIVRIPISSVITLSDLQEYLDMFPYDPRQYTQNAAAQAWRGFDLGTFLAELRKVIDQCFNLYNKVYQGVKSVRNRNSGLTFREAWDFWLEFRYGWRTLAFDTQDIASALNDIRVKYRIFTGRSGRDFQTTVSDIRRSASYSAFSCDFMFVDEVTVGVTGHYAAKAWMPYPKVFVNPLITTYELIPYSFILDWFLNLGTVLRAFSTVALASVDTASLGYIVDVRRTYTGIDHLVKLSDSSSVTLNVSFQSTGKLLKRDPSSVSFLPAWVGDTNFDVNKLFDVIGIFTQRVQNLAFR